VRGVALKTRESMPMNKKAAQEVLKQSFTRVLKEPYKSLKRA
jgi:hypothetical protein